MPSISGMVTITITGRTLTERGSEEQRCPKASGNTMVRVFQMLRMKPFSGERGRFCVRWQCRAYPGSHSMGAGWLSRRKPGRRTASRTFTQGLYTTRLFFKATFAWNSIYKTEPKGSALADWNQGEAQEAHARPALCPIRARLTPHLHVVADPLFEAWSCQPRRPVLGGGGAYKTRDTAAFSPMAATEHTYSQQSLGTYQ